MRNKIYFVLLWVGLTLSFGYAQQDIQKVTEEGSYCIGHDMIRLLDANRYFEAKSLYDTLCVKMDTSAEIGRASCRERV